MSSDEDFYGGYSDEEEEDDMMFAEEEPTESLSNDGPSPTIIASNLEYRIIEAEDIKTEQKLIINEIADLFGLTVDIAAALLRNYGWSKEVLIEKYYVFFNNDFQVNKNFCDEIALIPSKKLRNKIAGYVTHLIKRMKKGSVSGISLKLQEDINKNSVNRTPDDEFEKKIRSLKLNSEIRLLINYLKKSSVLGEEAVSLQLKN